MNALVAKLHRGLSLNKLDKIGISFPNHHKILGNTLRLHGTLESLNNLRDQNWYKGLTDYITMTNPERIPDHVQYRCVSRKQRKSAHNKRTRVINKGWLNEAQALEKFPDQQDQKLKEPYAEIRSLSTNSIMRLYIDHGELREAPQQGVFSSYGLSKEATIPWF